MKTPVTISHIATSFGISKNHLVKVAHRLGKLGFITTTRGRSGGLALAHPADEISLGQVVRVMEPGFDIVECFDMQSNTCAIADVCRLRNALSQANSAFLQALDVYTLADMLMEPNQLNDRLGNSLPTHK